MPLPQAWRSTWPRPTGRADTLTYQVLLASGKKCYSTTITVKPATRRTISADTKVDAELFELSPDGTVKSAEAKRSSKVQNQGAAPVAGSVTSIEPLVKDSVISGDFNGDSIPESVTITDELVPTAEGTTLLDSNESVSRAEGGMVKLGVKAKDTATGADADKKTNIGGLWTGLPTELPLYFVPGSDSTAGTVPLAFSLPGTTDADAPSVLSYLYFMDYTGTYVLPAALRRAPSAIGWPTSCPSPQAMWMPLLQARRLPNKIDCLTAVLESTIQGSHGKEEGQEEGHGHGGEARRG